MTSFREEALAALRRLTRDPAAEFRDDQLEAIERLVLGRTNVLCVQRTGWGKSAVYFIATRLLRAQGAGATVIVSPLLALMRNQVDAARRLGIRATTINSSNLDDWDEAFQEIETRTCDLLLISPERLNNPAFRARAMDRLLDDAGLVVVDEAHCISDWGHDFRPDYRRMAEVVANLRPDAAVLCTTATANDRVVADVESQLASAERPLVTIRGPLERASLRLEVVDLPLPATRLAWLATHLPTLTGSGIVYCATVGDTELVASWLDRRGIAAVAYSGETDPADRERIEQLLTDNATKAVVATSALGMGYDKPDLGFVVHFQAPGSAIAYYQQVGRAGRGCDQAHAVMLRGSEDREIQDYFIDVAFPPREQVEAVLDWLRSSEEGATIAHIEEAVNLRRGRLEAMLKVLEVEGAVARATAPGRWSILETDWAYDQERVDAVTRQRRQEQAAMEAYAATGDHGELLATGPQRHGRVRRRSRSRPG